MTQWANIARVSLPNPNEALMRFTSLTVLSSAAALVLLAACAGRPAAPALASGVELANMDRSVRPQDDFYRYVNGT